MGKAKTRAVRAAPDSVLLLRRARVALGREGVVKISALGPVGVREGLLAELTKDGFEVSKSNVRRPIAQQLESALADGAFIPLKGIAGHAPGATAAEAKQVAMALVARGAARLVLRGTEEVVVPSDTPVVSRDELRSFDVVAKIVAKVAKSKNGASILRSDLAEALAKVLPNSHSTSNGRAPRSGLAAGSTATKDRPDDVVVRILSAVEATRDVQTGLSFVPAIVAQLRPGLSSDAVTAALLTAANGGLIELRPEGGINRLSAEELALCPQGPQGTRLSWARRTENRA